MYKVKTRFGVEYNYIHNWNIWALDENFIEFRWGKNNYKGEKKEEILILPKSEILSIQISNL